MKWTRKFVVSFVVSLAFTFCFQWSTDGLHAAQEPQQQQEPPPPAATSATSASTEAEPLITLEQMLDLVDTNNFDLVSLRERLTQAEAGVSKAWTNLLPQVSVAGVYTHNRDEAKLDMTTLYSGLAQLPGIPDTDRAKLTAMANAGPTVIQPFDQWTGVAQASLPILLMPAYYGIAAAKKAAEATALGTAHARNELFFGVIQAYHGSVAAKRFVELSGKLLESAKEQERIAKNRYDAGELPKVGYLRAGVERAKAEQDLRGAENFYASVRLVLATLAGINGLFSVESPSSIPETPAGNTDDLVRTALDARRDIRASRVAIEAADDVVSATLWKIAPIVTANGQYRWTNSKGFTGENDTWSVTLTAAWNLYDGGLRYAELDESRSKERQARAEAQKLELSVAQEVRTAVLDLETARSNFIKANEQERLAEEVATLVQAQFNAGTSTYIDVVDSNNARFAAGTAKLKEDLAVQLAALKLIKSIGKFDDARKR